MKKKPRYELKLSKLEFISPVDLPAQETATVRLIKRANGNGSTLEGTARVVKRDDELGIVFLWAFTNTTPDGADYYDLQGDHIHHDITKAALNFMLDGGRTDEMHDGEPDGWTPFCMPLTRETSDAYGVVTKTYGLMVGIKPSAEVFAKFKSGEYTGVSIAGLGERVAVKRAPAPKVAHPRVVKQAAVTGEVDGHVHALSVEDPGCEWISVLTTSWGTSTDAATSHGHVWTYDADTGAITIAQDSGHTHSIDAVVPPAVLAIARGRAAIAALALGAEAAAVGAALVEEIVEGAAAGTVVVSIAARAPAANSTPGAAPAIVAPHQEQTSMPILLKHLLALAVMPDAERAYASTLTADDQAVKFLDTPPHERAAVVKAMQDADPIVHTTTDGLVIRKSAGETALAFAKRSDAQAAQLAVQATEIAKATAETERVTLEKRATTELAFFSKGAIATTDVRTAILKAIDGIQDEAIRKEALVVMKGANAAMKTLHGPLGVNPEQAAGGAGTEDDELRAAVEKYAETHKLPYEAAFAKATGEDPNIRKLYAAAAQAPRVRN